MPTYRIPVRGRISGYVLVTAEDPVLAAESFRTVERLDLTDISKLDLFDWTGGEPVEVEP